MRVATTVDRGTPHAGLSLVPMAAVLIFLNVPAVKVDVIYALGIGILVTMVLFWRRFPNLVDTITKGAANTVVPIVNTCADVGYGMAIAATAGFGVVSAWLLTLPMHPIVSLSIATNIMAAITGSASGGMGIVLETLAPKYLALGLSPDLVHRIVVMSSGCFDAMPHNGAVITMLAVAGLTHRQALQAHLRRPRPRDARRLARRDSAGHPALLSVGGRTMNRLRDKVCVITGATSGIGKRTAEIFAAEGAKLVIAGRREAEGRAVARSIGEGCDFVRTDVTFEDQVRALMEFAVRKHGRIDCLFNNAGGPAPVGGIEDIPVEGFDAAMAVLVRSVMLGMKHAAPVMRKQALGQHHQQRLSGRASRGLFLVPRLSRGQGRGRPPDALRRHGAGRKRRARELDFARLHPDRHLRQGAGADDRGGRDSRRRPSRPVSAGCSRSRAPA